MLNHNSLKLNYSRVLAVSLIILLFPVNCFCQDSSKLVSREELTQADATTHEIASEVMSPFCPGRTLNDCPSSNATELKKKINEMIRSGNSNEQVFDYLYSVYGDGIRAVPRKEGFGLVAWITPFVFLGLGAGILLIWLRINKKESLSEAADLAKIDEDMLRRIDSELK